MNDQRDAAVSERERTFVARLKRNAANSSLDLSAQDLDDNVTRLLEGQFQRGFREDGHDAIESANEAHEAGPHEKHRVITPQSLDTHADPGVLRKMNSQRRFDAIIRPLSPAMDDHPFAAILRDPESLRRGGREDFDGVDPGPAPELPRVVRPPQPDVRRAVPAEIVEHNRPICRSAARAKDQAKRLDGLPTGVWQAPRQDRLRA